jgi:transcriptional regulator with XRE-family HTH domain
MPSLAPLLPQLVRYLTETGENIRLARLRRKLSTAQVAERAGIGRPTLLAIERGRPSVRIGAYLQVLFVLGLEKNVLLLANQDPLGQKLQDVGLQLRERAPKSPRTQQSAPGNGE